MSGLTKRIVYADKYLSAILGVSEGALVSYAEISKGLHEYIRKNDLKNPESIKRLAARQRTEDLNPTAATVESNYCQDCGEPIPKEAIYCDMCGVKQ